MCIFILIHKFSSGQGHMPKACSLAPSILYKFPLVPSMLKPIKLFISDVRKQKTNQEDKRTEASAGDKEHLQPFHSISSQDHYLHSNWDQGGSQSTHNSECCPACRHKHTIPGQGCRNQCQQKAVGLFLKHCNRLSSEFRDSSWSSCFMGHVSGSRQTGVLAGLRTPTV